MASGMDNMRWLIESTMVFLGTLIAAALVTLGAPALAELAMVEAVQRGSDATILREAASGLIQMVWSATGSTGGR